MKTLTLADYNGRPFCVYINTEKMTDEADDDKYYCLEEVDTMMLQDVLLRDTKGHGLLYRHHHNMIQLSSKKTLLGSASMISIAQILNMHALAELCSLRVPDLELGAAAPLLPSIVSQPHLLNVHPHPSLWAASDTDDGLCFASPVPDFAAWLAGKTAQCQQTSQCPGDLSPNLFQSLDTEPHEWHDSRYQPHPHHRQQQEQQEQQQHNKEEQLASFMHQLSQHPLWQGAKKENDPMWAKFSSWFGDYAQKPVPPSLLATFKTRKQQQAIIASRQLRTHSPSTSSSATSSSASVTAAARNTSSLTTQAQQNSNNNSTNNPHHQARQPERTLTRKQRCSSLRSTPPVMSSSSSAIVSSRRSSSSTTASTLSPPPTPIRSWRSVSELHNKQHHSPSNKRYLLPPPWAQHGYSPPLSKKYLSSQYQQHQHHQQQQHSYYSHQHPYHPQPQHDHCQQHHPQPRKWQSMHSVRHASNLDLLATQATQRLPVRPSHSEQNVRLPSPNEMLASCHPSSFQQCI
ncbi:hypothetical protein BCR43DRAFT_485919 [Syncephalastrum racemosum]|uniref:Uncharacterized protein n=1 Tax=Syncephalastrum racemosum TaxID=13706 RepID=A0A1X2HN89_SYNRA|nr:hypothetical protein BCR43DRAFT_485919 [Syncephalastrum racemosum]